MEKIFKHTEDAEKLFQPIFYYLKRLKEICNEFEIHLQNLIEYCI